MNKSARMEAFVGTLGAPDSRDSEVFDPCYLGYFECFNTQRYYEAHDVLEHLWLKEGRDAPDYTFYKGLIQLAGGFVHLKLQNENSRHPKHGRRLHPARRLLLMAAENLTSYGSQHQGINLETCLALARSMISQIEKNDFQINPWDPVHPPILSLPKLIL